MTVSASRGWNKAALQAAWLLMVAMTSLVILSRGITFNQALTVICTLIVLTLWRYNRVNGVIAATFFFMVKAVFVRFAFALDYRFSGTGGADLLGVTPALLLAGLIIWQLYFDLVSGRSVGRGRTRILLAMFCLVAFASIFNPVNSLLNGAAGFERNILPNMMVLFLTASVFNGTRDLRKLVNSLLVLGLISCLYTFGQFYLGIYPWEKDWFLQVAFKETTSGWLTVGLRGLEFRVFSIFYGYMDFAFTNVLIFAVALAYRADWNARWRRVRWAYFIAWFAVLLLSLERMPLVMSLVVMAAIYYFRSSPNRRKVVVWSAIAGFIIIFVAINAAGPYLRSTGAAKYIRLAELANPFTAGSIGIRSEQNWGPTIDVVKSNLLGIGMGFGSQTKFSNAVKTDLQMGPHNELLQKALETGLIGSLVYLLLWLSVFRDARQLSKGKDPPRRFAHGIMAVTLAFWLCSMVNLPFSGSSGLAYWFMAGVVIALKDSERINRSTTA